MINENATHGLCGGGIEMSSAGPRNFPRADELDIRLVDQSSGRQRVIRPLTRKVQLSRLAELVVDQRKKSIRRRPITARGGIHQDRGILGLQGRRLHATMVIESALFAPNAHSRPHCRRRRLFTTTLTLLMAIAALAMIGLRSQPVTGYSTPAAMGIPITL